MGAFATGNRGLSRSDLGDKPDIPVSGHATQEFGLKGEWTGRAVAFPSPQAVAPRGMLPAISQRPISAASPPPRQTRRGRGEEPTIKSACGSFHLVARTIAQCLVMANRAAG